MHRTPRAHETMSYREKLFVTGTVAGILILGGFLRFYRIGEKGLWWDEVLTVRLATVPSFEETLPLEQLMDPAPQLDIASGLSRHTPDWLLVLRGQTHPPLSFHLLRDWFRWTSFPVDEATARSPFAILGILNIFLVFILGSRLHSWKLGLAAAALFAISPFEIYESQEVRGYTLFTLTALLSYMTFLTLPRQKGGWALFFYSASLVAAFYTHYFAILIVLSQGLILFLPSLRPHFKRWAAGLILAAFFAALYLPRLLIVQFKTPHPLWVWEGPLLPQLLESLVSLPVKLILGPDIGFLFYRLPKPHQILWGLAGGAWFGVWLSGLSHWVKRGQKHIGIFLILAGWMMVPLFFLSALDLVRHSVTISLSRYFSFASPAFILLLIGGFLGLTRTRRWIWVLMLISVMSLVLADYYRAPVKQQDWKGLSRFLQSESKREDLLVLNQVGRPLWVAPLNTLCLTYYHGTEGHPIYLTGDAFSQMTKEVLQKRKRFWLISQNRFFHDPGPPLEPIVQREFQGIGSVVLFEARGER